MFMKSILFSGLALLVAFGLFICLGVFFPSKKYSVEVEIFKEPAICWYFYNKPVLMKKWMDNLISAEVLPDINNPKQIILNLENADMKMNTLTLDVETFDRPEYLKLRFEDDSAEHVMSVKFVPTDLGTRVIQKHSYTFKNVFVAAVMHLMNTDLKEDARKSLNSLKRVVEDEYPPKENVSDPDVVTPEPIESLDSLAVEEK